MEFASNLTLTRKETGIGLTLEKATIFTRNFGKISNGKISLTDKKMDRESAEHKTI